MPIHLKLAFLFRLWQVCSPRECIVLYNYGVVTFLFAAQLCCATGHAGVGVRLIFFTTACFCHLCLLLLFPILAHTSMACSGSRSDTIHTLCMLDKAHPVDSCMPGQASLATCNQLTSQPIKMIHMVHCTEGYIHTLSFSVIMQTFQ